MVVANKRDLVEGGAARVSEKAGRARAAEFGASYIETSARTGYNVAEAFATLVRCVRARSSWRPPLRQHPPLVLL